MPEPTETNEVLLDFFDRLALDATLPVNVNLAAGIAGNEMRGLDQEARD